MTEEAKTIAAWLIAEAKRMESEAVANARALKMPVHNVPEAVTYRRAAAAIGRGDHQIAARV